MNVDFEQRRRGWLVMGTLLWGAVLAAGVFMWHQHKELAAQAESQGETQTITISVEASDENDDGRPPQLELHLLWPKEGVADFRLTDQREQTVTKQDMLGSPWVVSFIFTHCEGTCPRVTAALRVLQDRLKKLPVKLVSISVQPEVDTPKALAKYADAIGADYDRWRFLTGDKDQIFALIRGSFLQYVSPSRDPNPAPGWEVEHTNNVCLVDASGRVVGKYNSIVDTEVAKLRRDVARLVKYGTLDEKSAADPIDREKTSEPKDADSE